MKFLSPFAVCLAATLTLPAGSEETLDEIRARLNVRPEAWEGFGAGSYVDVKTTTTVGDKTVVIEERVTLAKRDKDGTRLERCRIERSKGADGNEVIELGTPSVMVFPVKSPWEFKDLKEVRKEDLVVGGKTISCRVIRATYTFDMGSPVPGQKGSVITFPAIIWWSPIAEGSNGIVRIESEQPKGQLPQISVNTRMIDTAREARVGNSPLLCGVYSAKGLWQGEKEMHDVESWVCAAVPGRAVRIVERGKNDASPDSLLKTVTTEVMAFEAKKEAGAGQAEPKGK